jgi:hypothetical protein
MEIDFHIFPLENYLFNAIIVQFFSKAIIMTQEELDALMNEDMDMGEEENISIDTQEEVSDSIVDEEENESLNSIDDPHGYRVSAMHSWPPPPPTDDNKMVHQLDDVTKESEEKASEIFDIVETISNDLMDGEETLKEVLNVIDTNIALFNTLSVKFPHVDAFKTQLEHNSNAKEYCDILTGMLQNSGDNIVNIMDIMQYQDIHRQKIERVINVMRALSTYMNHLFSGKIDDSKRVTSAVHIHGDTDTTDVVTSDDIEALLASFGQK